MFLLLIPCKIKEKIAKSDYIVTNKMFAKMTFLRYSFFRK